MKLYRLILMLTAPVLIMSCDSSSSDGETIAASAVVNFNFKHVWNDTTLNDTNLTTVNVTNANGEVMDIVRLRYLVSRFQLVNAITNQAINFSGYKFTDISDPQTYNFDATDIIVPPGEYKVRFIWGFNENDNIDGAYPDLNTALWNWPQMLGGGYHFLQLDGNYNTNTASPSPYNFHNGTARLSTNPDVFEQNFATIELEDTVTLSRNSNIEIVMNIAEFFVNPNTWNLNVLDTPLMPNYTAQKMMQENVETVFSLGEVTFF